MTADLQGTDSLFLQGHVVFVDSHDADNALNSAFRHNLRPIFVPELVIDSCKKLLSKYSQLSAFATKSVTLRVSVFTEIEQSRACHVACPDTRERAWMGLT